MTAWHQLWVAATPREESVAMVLDAVPEEWTATLLDKVETRGSGISKNEAG